MSSSAPYLLDCHADTVMRVIDEGADLASIPDGHLDLDRLEEAGVGVQFFAIWVSPDYLPKGAEPDRCFERANAMIDALEEQAHRHSGRMRICRTVSEIESCVAEGKLAACMGIEGGHAIEDDLGKLRALAERGVRYMTLTWNNHLSWAESCMKRRGGEPEGLSEFGREVVEEMAKLGVVADLSHVSPRTFDHVLAMDVPPPICSHSCARALREHPRNVDDGRLAALGRKGGGFGLNFLPAFLGKPEDVTIDTVVEHAKHILEVGGPELLMLGSDFDGIEHTPAGLDDARDMRKLFDRIATPDPVGLAHGNMLRVLRAWE
jgi:membrane dipeptidase